ncbi:MAG: ABC transporter ATP-binding protein [Lentisphaerae bacterium]|jgi:ABC-type multidrug transport system fused ATPase/permease subunit|nr:ABC transporter ATP-binding protein [Lentisphaerota bacterium]
MATGNEKSEKDKKKLGNIRKILVFMQPYRLQLIGLFALTALLSIIAMFPPLVTRALVDDVFTQGKRNLFFGLGCLMVGIPIVSTMCGYIQSLSIAYLGQRFVFDIRCALYQHFLNLSLRFFSKNSVGKLVYRLMGDSGTIQSMLTGQSVGIISDLIVATFAIIATFAINWRLAILLVLIVAIFVINYNVTIEPIIKASRATRWAYDRLSGGVQNRLVANMAVKTFGAEGRENEAFKEHSDNTLHYGKLQGIAGNTFSMNVNLIQALGRSLLYFLGCAMILNDSMTYGDVTAFTSYAMQLLGPAVRFSQLVSQLQQVSIATERLFEIFDEKPEVVNDPDPVFLNNIKGQVDLLNVQFYYEEGKNVINDVTIHVKPGETVALIGPTGCGKSTILNLLLRFYDITGGELLIDGVNIKKLDLHTFRKQFGIVLQESLLFSVSIRENIRYSRPTATDQEIEDAAKVAEIHDFIMGLENGYDTLVGDYGVELSVGQKQRLNIARAICANPAILIMDEATSSLDSDSEQAIQRAMGRVLEGRTSFVVAHRLSTIKNANQIILLDKGVIQEHGTHDELMAIPDGRYHELYTKHMGSGVISE